MFANSCRWLSFYTHKFDYYVLLRANNPRSIFFFQEDAEVYVSFKLLRVLAFVPSSFLQRVPARLEDLVFLRYLSVTEWFEGLDYVVSTNRNLQTLVVSSKESELRAPTLHLPSTIWDSPRLQYLELDNSYVIDPPTVVKDNMQTLSWVCLSHCRTGVYSKFPNIKKLKVFASGSNSTIILDNLERLERLTIISVAFGCVVTLPKPSLYPSLLKKLRFDGTNLSERDLMVIARLPRLEILKLENAFHGKQNGFYNFNAGGETNILRTNNPRSIFFFQEDAEIYVSFKLLRVLAFVPSSFLQKVPGRLKDLIFLRYLSVTEWFEGLDYVVSTNQNLQTLVVSSKESQLGIPTIHLPSTIWKSPRLQHLELDKSYVIDPPSMDKDNMQTLSWVCPTHCRAGVYCRFPNIKKLKVFVCCSDPISLETLKYLERLERLSISVSFGLDVTLPMPFLFPSRLKKLRLNCTYLPVWELKVIERLPRLEILKLENAFRGNVWEVEEGFYQLKFLLLENKMLVKWIVRDGSFPCLEHLVLRFCNCLKEIPMVMKDILTLESIELWECCPSLITSAKRIQECQREDYGNEILENINGVFLVIGIGQGAEEPTKPFSVFFVCLGNICRSPATEGVFTDLIACLYVFVCYDDWPIRLSDFKDFDIIIAMEEQNKARGSNVGAVGFSCDDGGVVNQHHGKSLVVALHWVRGVDVSIPGDAEGDDVPLAGEANLDLLANLALADPDVSSDVEDIVESSRRALYPGGYEGRSSGGCLDCSGATAE
nr:putative late blight resistance protein homolog R1A-10 [Ipomoea batatas]